MSIHNTVERFLLDQTVIYFIIQEYGRFAFNSRLISIYIDTYHFQTVCPLGTSVPYTECQVEEFC